MRILRSIRSVNPAGGGPIEGIKQVARVHLAAGHETEIVSLDSPDDAWVKECPVQVHAMGPVRSKFGYSARFVPWLAEHRRKFEAVIVSGLWQYSGFGVWRALRGTETPYFVFPHGMLDPWFKRTYPLKHLKKWLYWPWADYRVLRDARAVLFTSEEERRAARESFWLYRCNEVVVNYGIAAPTGDPAAQKQAVLERFPELAGKRVLLFLSRVHEKKGCDLLIKAFAKVAGRQAPLHLVLAGPCAQPEYLEGIRNLAADLCPASSVSFPGMLTGDLKWGMLQLAEAFVLPSHQENFGIAVAEALACGTPVLISNKVNIWREIEQDGAGLVDEDDEPGTTRLLEKWLALSDEGKEAMRETARRSFQARFEVKRAAESLIQAIA
jgi:glycosyltransferase involved in cell wall biosynthesis